MRYLLRANQISQVEPIAAKFVKVFLLYSCVHYSTVFSFLLALFCIHSYCSLLYSSHCYGYFIHIHYFIFVEYIMHTRASSPRRVVFKRKTFNYCMRNLTQRLNYITILVPLWISLTVLFSILKHCRTHIIFVFTDAVVSHSSSCESPFVNVIIQLWNANLRSGVARELSVGHSAREPVSVGALRAGGGSLPARTPRLASAARSPPLPVPREGLSLFSSVRVLYLELLFRSALSHTSSYSACT